MRIIETQLISVEGSIKQVGSQNHLDRDGCSSTSGSDMMGFRDGAITQPGSGMLGKFLDTAKDYSSLIIPRTNRPKVKLIKIVLVKS